VIDYWTAFILGLVGSLHCAGMCGPLALALPATGRSGASFVASRIAYNAGRVITYCVLGIIFGLVGKTLVLAGIQRWISIALGVALLAGLFATRKLVLWNPVIFLLDAIKRRMSGLLKRRSLTALATLGILNGFLPCGLVYVACTGAIASGGIVSGAIYMAAFGAGTIPLMLAIGVSGKLIPLGLRLKLLKAIPVSVFLLATLLILRGMALGIPYVSPDLSQPSCCQ
jgi:sulfite exporter TauE/SafE